MKSRWQMGHQCGYGEVTREGEGEGKTWGQEAEGVFVSGDSDGS